MRIAVLCSLILACSIANAEQTYRQISEKSAVIHQLKDKSVRIYRCTEVRAVYSLRDTAKPMRASALPLKAIARNP